MSRKRLILWQSLVLFATIVLALAMPVHLVAPSLVNEWFHVVVGLISCVYAVDLVIEIQTARRRGSAHVQHYLRTWLVVDALAVVPYVLLLDIHALSFLQFIKIIHVAVRINESVRQSPRYASVLRLSHFAYILVTVLQWTTCARMAIHPDSSIPAFSEYMRALFWATVTLANAGYVGEAPTTTVDIGFAVVTMIAGLVMYGYLIGNIASILNKIDPARVHHEEILEKVHAFMRYRNLPPDLERRINDYYSYVWEQRLGYDETSVMAALPPGLKTEVSLYLKREVLERVNIFRDASEEFIREIAIVLHAQIVMPGDYVFKVGDTARSMYFLSKGSVEVLSAEGDVLTTLQEGDFFGEMALIHKRKRNASVRARSHADLYVLDVTSFERILNEHPEFKSHIESVVKERTLF